MLGELGFGTGLNVAAAMRVFATRGHDRGHLWIWSVEGYPLDVPALRAHAAAAAARWPEAAPSLSRLAACYPEPVRGQTTLRLRADVTLTLAVGEASEMLADAAIRADAWFLDGFSPSANPGMWTDEVLALVAARSRPGATASTFSVAGQVRRGLTAAGFGIERAPGFGRKREMLTARLPGARGRTGRKRVAVLGAGIAGASAAWHLRRLGSEVAVYDPGGPGAGASGNPVGLLTPRLEAQDSPLARTYRDAFDYALGLYAEAAPGALRPMRAGVLAAPGRAEKVAALRLWREGRVVPGEDGFACEAAATLDPLGAVTAMLSGAPVRRARAEPVPGEAAVRSEGREERFDALVVATGPEAAALDLGLPVFAPRRGQIDWFAGPRLAGIRSGDGYAAPYDGGVVAGATYGRPALGGLSAEDTEANRRTAARLSGQPPGEHRGGRASLRAATPDRHPAAGEASPGVFVLSGLGSRGLVTGPLLGAEVAARIHGAAVLDAPARAALDPWRFAERARRRDQLPAGRA